MHKTRILTAVIALPLVILFILTLISRTNKSWISLFARYDRFDDAVFNDSPLVERGWGLTLGFVYSRFTFRSKQTVEAKQRGKQE